MKLQTLLEARKKKRKKRQPKFTGNPIVINPDDSTYQKPIREGVESDRAILVWGRFQGVTKAHSRLLEYAADISREAGAHLYVATSNSVDKKRNPFTPDQKHKMLGAVIAETKIPAYVITAGKSNNIVDVLNTLAENGYRRVTLVVGPDRTNDYDNLIEDVEDGKITNLAQLDTITYDDGSRASVSSTILRTALQENDIDTVKKIAHPAVVSILMSTNLYENKHEHGGDRRHVDRIQDKIQASLRIHQYKTVLARARKTQTMKTAPQNILYKRARRAAIRVVREKVAGTLGKKYEQLPYATRVQIDRNVRKRQSLINTIAISLIPRAKRLDVLRHANRAKKLELTIRRELGAGRRRVEREEGDRRTPENDHMGPAPDHYTRRLNPNHR